VQADSSAASQRSAAICITGAGSSNPAVRAALAFLRAVENADGGFPGFGGATSADSTGLALQGLAAYRDTPRGLSWTTVITDGAASPLTLHNPVDALLGLQTADSRASAGQTTHRQPTRRCQGCSGARFPPAFARSATCRWCVAAEVGKLFSCMFFGRTQTLDFLPCVYRFFAPQGEKTIDMKK
jgi:hypothetical protein